MGKNMLKTKLQVYDVLDQNNMVDNESNKILNHLMGKVRLIHNGLLNKIKSLDKNIRQNI